MNRLKQILGSRSAGIICFLFAIANRIAFTTLYSLIGVDTKLQLLYAKNLLAGKGMGVTKYFTGDLENAVFDTHQVFPPGFSFAIMPFLKVFGGDECKAVLAYDILVSILFIIAVRLLGKKSGLSPQLNNVVTLIAGASQYFFFMSWSSTDAIGVCLILFSLMTTIDITNKKESLPMLKATGIGLLFCSPFLFRYMYLPITFLLPFLILLSGIILKRKALKINSLKILAASIFFLTISFVFSLSVSGNALYVTDVGRGFFVNQLTECYPFLPASFINIDFGAQLIQSISGIDYSSVILFLKIINPLILLSLLFLLGRYINAHRKTLQLSTHSLLIIVGSLISVVILLLLVWLTLTYRELSWGYYKWTFVQDPRYFAFIYVFILILFFVCLQYYGHYIRNLLIRLCVLIGICCFATEAVHGIYYNIKILSSHKDLAYIREADDGFRSFPVILSDIKKQYPHREILVCSPDQFYLHTASEMGYKAIFDYDNFLQRGIIATKKSVLIMPIQSRDVTIINDYIEKKKPQLFTTVASTSFYVLEIDPQ